MRCDQARELLSPFEDGTLPSLRREALEEHLIDCEGCRTELAEHRRALQALRGLVADPTPEDEVARILAAVDAARAPALVGVAPASPEEERLAYRRALLAAAQVRAPSRRRRAAAVAGVWFLGAAAALVLAWGLGFLQRPEGSADRPEVLVERGAPAGAPSESIREPLEPAPAGPRSPAPGAQVSVDTAPLISVETAPRVSVDTAPLISVDTAPLARAGLRIWADLRSSLEEGWQALPDEDRFEEEPEPPGPAPLVADAEGARDPAPVARPPAFVEPPPPVTSVSFVRDGDDLELRMRGSPRERIPSLISLLDNDDAEIAALAEARLEVLRAQVHAVPGVADAVSRDLDREDDERGWWSGLFARDEAQQPRAPTSRDWARWWAAAEPLLPRDPGLGAS